MVVREGGEKSISNGIAKYVEVWRYFGHFWQVELTAIFGIQKGKKKRGYFTKYFNFKK